MPEPTDSTVEQQVDITAVPDGTQPSAAAVIAPDRDAVIKKYEAMYGQPAEPTADAVVAEPVAAESVVAAEPVAPVIDANTLALQAVVAELAALKQQMAPKPVEQKPAEQVAQADWLELLAGGKKAEGEQALIKLLGPEIQRQAVQEALQQIDMQRDVNDFVTKVRADNADILPMENYVAAMANARIQQAEAQGLIKTPADRVTVYKQAVNAEIENARKLVQTFRGAGKQEAATRNQTVVASPTIKPNAVNAEREAPKVSGEPDVETPQSYLAKRNAMHARNSGLSTTA